ncbi:MAG: PorP/SprF family type IX secretion system membrane protein, partial [Flaviramulus sp.]
MKTYFIYMILFFFTSQHLHAQDDGAVALNLAIRNSLKFNKYALNPTFSFVREQNKYISFSNKREWVQFDDAPQTYLFNYSGRFRENMGVGLGVFQQNYGVLTTFGGILNYAYNVVLDRGSNLTFGTNLGFYKSGIDDGSVVTNFSDPSLQNIPSNSILTLNPGINYGTEFFDFGLSINNLVTYNFTTSKVIEDNPQQSIQGHIMYTGYVNSRGFFDESKFTGFFRSEFNKDKNIVSGIIMITVPKGIWAQAGYSSLFGVSGGIGLNITNQVALEYNYEQAIGSLSSFGNSHEVTLAYKFKNNEKYNYSGDDDEQALINPTKKYKPAIKRRSPNKPIVDKQEDKKIAETQAKKEAQVKRLAEAAQAKAEREELAKIKSDAEALAKIREAEKQAIIDAKNKAFEEAEAKRLANEALVKLEAENKAKRDAEALAKKRKEEVQAIRDAENKAKEEAQAKLDEDKKAQIEAEAKRLEEVKMRESAEKKADTVQLEGVLVPIARDKKAMEIENLTKLTTDSNIKQQDLLIKLNDAVINKQKDLNDLKEENDLSEQGIFKGPKPFKSVSAENAAIESLVIDLDNIITSQNEKISKLENLYEDRLNTVPNQEEEINAFYLNEIQKLKAELTQGVKTKENLITNLQTIKIATDFERKRRIKRAAYDNEDVRY